MNEIILQYVLLVLVAFLSGIFATALFLKKSLAKSRLIQLLSVFLVSGAVGITFYTRLLSPPPPEAFADCDKPAKYPPTTISCSNKSNDYSSIMWIYEDGTVVKEKDVIEREIDNPGTYQVKLIAIGKGLSSEKQSVFETKFVIEQEPKKEAERIIVEKKFSRSFKGPASFMQTFGPDPGFKIVDAKLKIYSGKNAKIYLVSQTADRVVVKMTFTTKLILRGLKIEMERGWVEGGILLTQDRID